MQAINLRQSLKLIYSLFVDVDDVAGGCQVSTSAKDKLHKVIRWLQKSENVHGNDELNHYQVCSYSHRE